MSDLKISQRASSALWIICITVLIIPLIATGPAVILPDICQSFAANLAMGQWVISAFFLTFASFMAMSGSFADLYGRKKLYLIGVFICGISTCIAIFSTNIWLLIISRAVSGMGASAVTTSGSALLAHIYTGEKRPRAFAFFGTTLGVGIAFGPTIAGIIMSLMHDWRIFFALVGALCIICFILGFILPNLHDREDIQPDWTGMILFTASLTCGIFGVIQSSTWGWSNSLIISALCIAAILLVIFLRVELRIKHPMMQVRLFQQPSFLVICLMPVVLAFSFVALLMMLPSYLMETEGLSTGQAGYALLLLTLPTLVLPLITNKFARHLKQKTILLSIIFCGIAGTIWLMQVPDHAGIPAYIVPLILLGAGFGISLSILDGAAVSAVEAKQAGMAAGVFNTMRLGGESIAIAVLGAVTANIITANLAHRGISGAENIKATSQIIQGAAMHDLSLRDMHIMQGKIPGELYAQGMHDGLWVVLLFNILMALLIIFILKDPQRQAATQISENFIHELGDELDNDLPLTSL